MTKLVSRRTSILASAIVKHVENGGWLGASWPQYIKARTKGASTKLAYAMATKRYIAKHYSIMSADMSENFINAANEAAEMDKYNF